jgi:hypothetical protein
VTKALDVLEYLTVKFVTISEPVSFVPWGAGDRPPRLNTAQESLRDRRTSPPPTCVDFISEFGAIRVVPTHMVLEPALRGRASERE